MIVTKKVLRVVQAAFPDYTVTAKKGIIYIQNTKNGCSFPYSARYLTRDIPLAKHMLLSI